ncbi:hypothetical protein [Algoriphagus yeomjeoni]|uniref:Uncharacterized protein n=1 Tax=Algoriphagus yeomjeoni TaxID=291403 RepID=A0A327PJ75_9BACT|nr:hypothetical protein [Algoriphagus yeomjeoni]RAI91557.1 hypothetical protein LV83_01746 [Algoriphagus yeomjeoni]
MLSKILLPHRFQKFGWILLLPFAVLLFAATYSGFEFSWLNISSAESQGGISDFFDPDKENFSVEFAMIGVFLSLFLIAFSKEKEEDEYIQKLRLDSLLVACYTHTFILIIATLMLYGFGFLEFMGYNLFTIQLIFIGRFKWVLYKQGQSTLAF